MKLATNNLRVSGNCCKRFSRSEVKGQGHSETRCTSAAEAYISAARSRGSASFWFKKLTDDSAIFTQSDGKCDKHASERSFIRRRSADRQTDRQTDCVNERIRRQI